jgi:hypothetical protein
MLALHFCLAMKNLFIRQTCVNMATWFAVNGFANVDMG